MIAELKLRMDRPIDKTKHYISPGGYEVTLEDNSVIQFDFMDSEGYIDEKDKTIVTFLLKNDDIESFPDMDKLIDKYKDIKELSECYVFTGEANEPEINISEIISFELIDERVVTKDKYTKPVSTSVIEVAKHYAKENPDGTIRHETIYAFTDTARESALRKMNM